MIALTDIEDAEVAAFAREAAAFLCGQRWCERVGSGWLSFAIPGVLGVFLFDVDGGSRDVDPKVWVVVGDLPPGCIAQPSSASWQDVLEGYVLEMRRWVTAVQSGADVSELVPVNVPPTREYADMLASRLDFIQSEILSLPADSIEGTV